MAEKRPQRTSVDSLGLTRNGLVARSATGTAVARTLVGTTDRIVVSNGNGAGGDPTIDVGSAIVQTTRAVATGQGLTGGGDLSTNRTVSIASFSGLLAQDFDPTSRTYTKNTITTLKSYDVGVNGHIVLTGLALPARGNAALKTRLLVKYSNNTVDFIENATDQALTDTMQGLANFLMGDAASGVNAKNNGKRVQSVSFEVQNTDTNNDVTADIGVFRVRGYVFPAGGGSVTVTP